MEMFLPISQLPLKVSNFQSPVKQSFLSKYNALYHDTKNENVQKDVFFYRRKQKDKKIIIHIYFSFLGAFILLGVHKM